MAIGAKQILLHFSILVLCFVLYRYSGFKAIGQHRQLSDTKLAAGSMDSGAGELEVIFGVTIERNPTQSKLDTLGVSSWPTWSGSPSKFPWEFTATETMYFKEGKVKVFCDGHDGDFEIGVGDFVIFPKGMKVTWEIIEAAKKHYHLEK